MLQITFDSQRIRIDWEKIGKNFTEGFQERIKNWKTYAQIS